MYIPALSSFCVTLALKGPFLMTVAPRTTLQIDKEHDMVLEFGSTKSQRHINAVSPSVRNIKSTLSAFLLYQKHNSLLPSAYFTYIFFF